MIESFPASNETKELNESFPTSPKTSKNSKRKRNAHFFSTVFARDVAFPKLRWLCNFGNAKPRAKTVLKKCAFRFLLEFFDVFGLVGKLSLSSFVSFDAGNDSIISEFTT